LEVKPYLDGLPFNLILKFHCFIQDVDVAEIDAVSISAMGFRDQIIKEAINISLYCKNFNRD
jgi:hypothetical protein